MDIRNQRVITRIRLFCKLCRRTQRLVLEVVVDASGAQRLEVAREQLVVARALRVGREPVGGQIGGSRGDAARRRALAQAHEHFTVHERTVRDAAAVHSPDARHRIARVHERVSCARHENRGISSVGVPRTV